MTHAGWIYFGFWIADSLVRLLLVARIIYLRRPVSATLAWTAILLFLPFASVILYLMIGEVRLGSRRAIRFDILTSGLAQQARGHWRNRALDIDDRDRPWAPIARYGYAVGGMPPFRGNNLRLLGDSEEMLDALRADIDAATSHVHMLFYIWMDKGGPRIQAIADALCRAASRGVACRVLVDAVGSKHFLRGPVVGQLRTAGIQVVGALPANPLRMLFHRIDLRNHRKIVVIDGRIAYAGSQNLTDSTFRAGLRRRGPYIDATLRIDGPGAQALALVFLRDWQLDSEEDIAAIDPFLPALPAPQHDESVIQVVPSGPGPVPEAIHQALLTTIYSAREEIIMTTPYFVPDEATSTALRAAAGRGVDVTIVMPKNSDSFLVAAASRAYYHDLLESGVRILHYPPGLLHSKTVTVDRRIGLIGSTNFDNRSFWLNFEVTVFVYDDDFASVIRFLQSDYISHSEQIDLVTWRKRPRWQTFRDNAAQLLGPLL